MQKSAIIFSYAASVNERSWKSDVINIMVYNVDIQLYVKKIGV